MSPSTKNLKHPDTGIELWLQETAEAFYNADFEQEYDSFLCEKMAELWKLIKAHHQSELSLAVKGLREAVEKQMVENDKRFDVLVEDYANFVLTSDLAMANAVLQKALSSFDAKAKEILGESS